MSEQGKQKELSDLQFAGLALRTIGPDGLARLVGVCTFWWLSGVRGHSGVEAWAADMQKRGGRARSTLYKAMADLRKLHIAWAEAEGRPVKPAPALDEYLALVERLAEMGQVGSA